MDDSIKQELHQLVDKCDNEMLLEEAKVLLQTGNKGDWWDELSEEDKNLVMESEAQYGKGDFISHDELMKLFQDGFHLRIRKEYAAKLIQNLIKSGAVERVKDIDIDLTPMQVQALDKELDLIKNDPSYIKKWNDVKQQFKK